MTVSQQTQNIYITFIKRRPNVFDVGSTLYKCFAFTGVRHAVLYELAIDICLFGTQTMRCVVPLYHNMHS